MATGSPEAFMETIRRDEMDREWKHRQERANNPRAVAHDKRVDRIISAVPITIMIATGYWIARKLHRQ